MQNDDFVARSLRPAVTREGWRWHMVAVLMVMLALPGMARAQDAVTGPLRFTDSPYGLVVGDYVGNQVLFLDRATMQATSWIPIYTDATQSAQGKPLSVGWMNGKLYVGEERTGRIQVFQWSVVGGKNKKLVYGWVQVSASLTAEPIVQPSAIVADPAAGLLFVASKGQKQVLVLDAAGNLVRTIGGAGSAAPLGNPQAIALDPARQRVLVTDDSFIKSSSLGTTMYAVVQVYDYAGMPLGRVDGSTGAGNTAYKFARAQGVALDAAGRIYVADSYRHEVLVFAESSTTPNTFTALAKLGGKGIEPGQLLMPTGVYIDTAAAKVYVANTLPGRVEVFGTVAP